MVEASENPKRELTFNYTPTDDGGSYLAPIMQDGASKGTGDTRSVTLRFTQENPGPSSTDPWLATLYLDTQVSVQTTSGTPGMISVVLAGGTGYTVGSPAAMITADVTVNDVTIPALSIADAPETLAGDNAVFMITATIPTTGNLTVAYTPVKSGGNFLNESDGTDTTKTNTNSEVDRTETITFADVGGKSVAMLSVATVADASDEDGVGTITITLKEDPETTDSYTVISIDSRATASVSVIEVPEPVLSIVSTSVPVDEGSMAAIIVEASENPKRPLTFKYTPTETGTEYLAPVDEDGVTKGTGMERTVSLEFSQATPGSDDPWLATLNLMTKEHDALSGTITVALIDSSGYTVGNPYQSAVTVNDVSIPALSIADAQETIAGNNAEFVVTSSIPFVGDLDVVYNPEKSGGDYLDESDTDGSAQDSGPNTNSGVDRTITLTFAEDSGAYTATLSFATVGDANDADGGTITVTLQADSADPDTYTVSTENADDGMATVSVINAPVPELTISSMEVSTNEGTPAAVMVRASEDPKRPLTFKYTPTETGTEYLAPVDEDGDYQNIR